HYCALDSDPHDPGNSGGPNRDPIPKPDLMVRINFTRQPPIVTAGADIGPALQVTVQNIGARRAPRGFMIDIVLTGYPDFPRRQETLKRIISNYDLDPGASRTFPVFGAGIPICERPGPAYVYARVDSDNRVAEEDETNNVAYTSQIQIKGSGTIRCQNSTVE